MAKQPPELEGRAKPPPAPDNDELEARVAALEAQVEKLEQDVAALEQQVTTLEARVAALEQPSRQHRQ
jgi:hypothetical protein